jgi:DNA polymerase III epsilon subunit family exonuclease
MGDPDSAPRPTALGLTFFPQQWRAVAAPVGPVLVLAGPGAGKTRCLVGRIGHLVAHHGASPDRVCAVTFTNKAAQEVQARLRRGLGDRAEHLTLGTIHALCLDVLRAVGQRAGLPAGFGVADDAHQRLVLSRLGVHSKRHRPLLTLFGRRRLQGYELTKADEALFWRYQRELRSHYLIDYDEILDLARKLLESSAAIRAAYQARWDHILVDEFQDLDLTQYAILCLLAEGHRSLFAVGDDEQSIFSWRGADPRVIVRFVKDFGVTEPVVLDVNCRCSRAIFAAARKILPPCELFEKRIEAVRASAFPVRVHGAADESQEVAWVVEDLLADLGRSGLPRGEYAILYRTHEIGRRFEEALVAAGVPCQPGKGQALGDDPVIGQVIAALRVVLHPESDLEVERLAELLFPESLLGEVRRAAGGFLARVRAHAELSGPDAGACWRFLYQVENLRGLARVEGGLRDVVNAVLAQGLGAYENPLEPCHEDLEDPEALPAARELGDALLGALAGGARVLLTPAGGLEIAVKVMLRRVLPGLAVHYLALAGTGTETDLVLVLGPDEPPAAAGRVLRLPDRGRCRVAQVFKALQYAESRPYRKMLADYVAFDTETTGKDPEQCEVIELAAVKVSDGHVVDEFHALVRPGRPIAPGATAVHGYRDEDLRGQPTFAEVWPRFRAFVGDRVPVAHNGHRFDVPLLLRLAAPWGGLGSAVPFDTLPLARSLFPVGSLRLADLAARFGVRSGRSHHALDDARCLAEVFERLQQERLRRSRKTCLPNLLDCVALGMALEGGPADSAEDAALRRASPWHAVRQHSSLVDAYLEEAEALGGRCLPLEELVRRMTGKPAWGRGSPPEAPQDRYADAYARLFRLVARVKATSLEGGVREFLDMAALSRSDGSGVEPGRVSLLTFHATKGLEFSRVYVTGVEDNQVPGSRALADGNEADVREARRLLYVAMTRARDRLTLTYCRERGGRPTGGTLFLEEMGLVGAAPARTPAGP